MEEIWKDIKNFEGYYQVSNLGRVRSLDRIIVYNNGRKHIHKGKILNLKPKKTGYIDVYLQKQFDSKNFLLHRLVAEAFIPNPNNYPIINHKDENPSNNCVDNLEWCTYEYNNNYGSRNSKLSNSRKGMKFTEAHKQKLSKSKLGNKNAKGSYRSLETRRKVSNKLKGRIPWNKGIKINREEILYENKD